MHRRDLLRYFGASCCAAVAAASGYSAVPPQKTALGIVVYCLGINRRLQRQRRDLFSPPEFLDYCHSLGAGGIQLPLGRLEEREARKLGDDARQRNMFLEAIVGPPFADGDVERFAAEIQAAAWAEARAVRTVILPGRRYERFKSWEEFLDFSKRGRRALLRAAPIVERHRVPLAVENHKDHRLEMRLALLEEIDSEFVGACVDTGNSFALLEDPLEVVEAYAPWAFSVHLKDQAVRESRDGFLLADVALGDGFLDLQSMVGVLRRAKPDVRFSLETITRDPLAVPCLAEPFWTVMQDATGGDLARTLRIVRQNEAASLPRISRLSDSDQGLAETHCVTKSLAFARDSLQL
jgi:sugar phosphate isomerase/epimerase